MIYLLSKLIVLGARRLTPYSLIADDANQNRLSAFIVTYI